MLYISSSGTSLKLLLKLMLNNMHLQLIDKYIYYPISKIKCFDLTINVVYN